MKIEIYADFVCPYCYAGDKQLMDAVKEVDPSIEVEMISYELAPGALDNNDLRMNDVLQEKFGMSPEDVKSNSIQVKQMIDDAGLEINSEDIKFSNTLKAHTLLQYAKENNIANELSSAIYHAYFVEGAYLNKDETLIEIASKVGIDEETFKEVITSQRLIDKVTADRRKGAEIGVKSVPQVIIDGKLSLSGAQPKQNYIDAINQVKKNK